MLHILNAQQIIIYEKGAKNTLINKKSQLIYCFLIIKMNHILLVDNS